MKNTSKIAFDDLQGLLRYGYGKLSESCFLLLNIKDATEAKRWLECAPISDALEKKKVPTTALQIAFSVEGLREMGVKGSVVKDFSDEFLVGMSADERRSNRLGDVDLNAPSNWKWGNDAKPVPHVLLLIYAEKGGIDAWRKTVEGDHFTRAFEFLSQLPTLELLNDKNEPIEPFGFRDGISQPTIDWDSQQSTDLHARDKYSNLLATGEVVLGYPNEYGLYTTRPLIDPEQDKFAQVLPCAIDEPGLKDFGRNGTYLIIRQLSQDVPGFWRYLDKTTGIDKPAKREKLAAAMVGRERGGTPLVADTEKSIPGISGQRNKFTYRQDPVGNKCPIGAHIRRSNPRNGDLPPGVSGFLSRLIKMLGFGQNREEEDLIASTRFHRILRRARTYGPKLTPEAAIKPDALVAERGLQFICLAASISRQFEFVQNAWVTSSKFGGVQQQRDPLLGHREPLLSGTSTDQFSQPDPAGPAQKICGLPQFITVRGGGYFFMPGLSALEYISTLPANRSDKT